MTALNPTPDYANPYWRLAELLAAFGDVAIIDIPGGGAHLDADTVDKLARRIAEDAELARLYRAQIWVVSGEAS